MLKKFEFTLKVFFQETPFIILQNQIYIKSVF